MKLPGEEESGGNGLPVVYMVIGVLAFLMFLVFVLYQTNGRKNSGSDYLKEQQAKQEQQELEEEAQTKGEDEQDGAEQTSGKRRAQDLDFWDMYPVEDDAGEEDSAAADRKTDSAAADTPERKDDADEQEVQAVQPEPEDPSTDGKHTLVTNRDGKQEWVLISPYLTKNTYDYTNMEERAGLKRYMENNREISYVGVDISQDSGAVDFARLKAAGIDYVMIRLGGRGYSTGQISLDEKFKEHIEGAIAQGLGVGVYFYSQAVNQDEAIQEVNFVVQNLEPYRANVKYPVVFDMEFVVNDKARIDGLSREDRTTVASSFMEGVKAAGYVPMFYGDKEWLIKEVDLAKLQSYDVWLAQEEDIPDYPYQYTMWQYTTAGVVDGITGDADLNICFVGYSQR